MDPNVKAVILDFYVDEPACLGVPPYLSPYCRYIAGALVKGGIAAESIGYLTVDQWRQNQKELASEPELVILIAGSTVPGKYLGGKPGTVAEILEFLEYRQKFQASGLTLLGGPIRHASSAILESIEHRDAFVIRGDIEPVIARLAESWRHMRQALPGLLRQHARPSVRDYQQVDDWSRHGAFLSTLHPNFPFLMNEMETYRGCTRSSYCSFCSESLYGRPVFRSVEGVIGEVEELYGMGNRYFRLGRQADLFTYGADMADCLRGFPRPNPDGIHQIYAGIRRVAPDLKVLHLDNANPGGISLFEKESLIIARTIAEYNTPGDTAAMGLESVDPIVCRENNLKADWDQALRAIEIINQVGADRADGIPKLLPGLNFLHGLTGESESTFQMNYDFLREVVERGLLLRRINIRQVSTHPETELADRLELNGANRPKKRKKRNLLDNKFFYFRDLIRKDIDQPMMKKVFPPGTVLKEVIPEWQNPGYILGRQIASYPVTVKIPHSDPLALPALAKKQPMTVIVTGYRERSLMGLSYPIRVNQLDLNALAMIPGVGKKRASTIVLKKPITDIFQLKELTEGDVLGEASDYIFETLDV